MFKTSFNHVIKQKNINYCNDMIIILGELDVKKN